MLLVERAQWHVKEGEDRYVMQGHSEQQKENDEMQEAVADFEDISKATTAR